MITNRIIGDERFLCFIYELDERKEWTNEEEWIKANPGLGTIKSLEYMKENVQRAKNDKLFLPTLLTKDFNIRETGTGSWLNVENIIWIVGLCCWRVGVLDEINDCLLCHVTVII